MKISKTGVLVSLVVVLAVVVVAGLVSGQAEGATWIRR